MAGGDSRSAICDFLLEASAGLQLDPAPFFGIWDAAHAVARFRARDYDVAPVEAYARFGVEETGLFGKAHIFLQDGVIAKREVRRLVAFGALAVGGTMIDVILHAVCDLIFVDF